VARRPCLWFSDWGAQEVIAADVDGKSEVILRVPSLPFCIDWLLGKMRQNPLTALECPDIAPQGVTGRSDPPGPAP
jgi:hypothetical protein